MHGVHAYFAADHGDEAAEYEECGDEGEDVGGLGDGGEESDSEDDDSCDDGDDWHECGLRCIDRCGVMIDHQQPRDVIGITGLAFCTINVDNYVLFTGSFDLLYGLLYDIGHFLVGAGVVLCCLEEECLPFGTSGNIAEDGVGACGVEFALGNNAGLHLVCGDVNVEGGTPASHILE